MTNNLQATTQLNGGVEMPWLGLGTFQADDGGEVEEAVSWALKIGYRSVDTASAYGNEQGVGRGIHNSDVPRERVFVTTKLWNDEQGYDQALRAFDNSLERLGMDYVDLYLVHWPVRGKINETWRAMESIQRDGRARAIGVSNFLEHHLRQLLDEAEVAPAVNQIEFHPHLQQPELRAFCQQQKIQVEAWSPLMKGQAFKLPDLQELAEKYDKTAGQINLRWQLQHDVVTIPKSVKKEHIQSNALLFDFELEPEDMARIDGLDQNRRIGPDPDSFAW